jgi:hypothetical protein
MKVELFFFQVIDKMVTEASVHHLLFNLISFKKDTVVRGLHKEFCQVLCQLQYIFEEQNFQMHLSFFNYKGLSFETFLSNINWIF